MLFCRLRVCTVSGASLVELGRWSCGEIVVCAMQVFLVMGKEITKRAYEVMLTV